MMSPTRQIFNVNYEVKYASKPVRTQTSSKMYYFKTDRHYFLYKHHSVKVQRNQIYQFSCMHITLDATYYIKLCQYTSITFKTNARSSSVHLSMF